MAEGELPGSEQMKHLAVYSLFAIALVAQKTDVVMDDVRNGSLLIQHRTVPPQALTASGATAIAEAFLSDKRAYKLRVLTMYSDSAAAAGQTQFCEGSYKQWKLFYDGFPKAHLGAAQVISTRAGAVLLFRSESGDVGRQILEGADPTILEADGASFEILYVAGRTRSKFERCASGIMEPVFFLKTSALLTPELSKKATAQLASNLAIDHLWAHFRNDIWFLCGEFPVFYPFSLSEPIPTDTAHRRSTQLDCYINCDGVPVC
jgi:hypothetical protein